MISSVLINNWFLPGDILTIQEHTLLSVGYSVSRIGEGGTIVSYDDVFDRAMTDRNRKLKQAALLYDKLVFCENLDVDFPPDEFRDLNFVKVIPVNNCWSEYFSPDWKKLRTSCISQDLKNKELHNNIDIIIKETGRPFTTGGWGWENVFVNEWIEEFQILNINSLRYNAPPLLDERFIPIYKQKYQQYAKDLEMKILEKMMEIEVPQFDYITLDDLISLRKDSTISSLRIFMNNLSSNIEKSTIPDNNIKNFNLSPLIDEAIKKELWEIATQHSPKPVTTIVEASISNVIPFVGLARDAIDIYNELKRKIKPRWIYALMKLKETSEERYISG